MTLKQKILKLLGKGTPMLSMDMAVILKVHKGAASEAAKELNKAGFIHVCEWRHNPKNGGNKVYAIGPGENAVKPEGKYDGRVRSYFEPKRPFVPHADVAAAWLRNPI